MYLQILLTRASYFLFKEYISTSRNLISKLNENRIIILNKYIYYNQKLLIYVYIDIYVDIHLYSFSLLLFFFYCLLYIIISLETDEEYSRFS